MSQNAPARVKSFWQWLVDKYGPQEAERRYKIWKNASHNLHRKEEWTTAVAQSSEGARNKVYTLVDSFLSSSER